MIEKQLVGLREDLTASKVIAVLNELSPQGVSVIGDEEGLLLGDEDQRVNKLGVVWDLNPNVLNKMLAEGVDFIVTHTYPFLRMKAAKLEGYACLNNEALYPNQLKKKLLRQKSVVVYRVHSSWDNAEGGNNDVLASLLGLTNVERVNFGRVGWVNPMALKELANIVKNKLGNKEVRFVGNPSDLVSRVMVVSGTGFLFPELIEYCYTNGVDVLISGDLVKEAVKRASELGVSLIDAGSRDTELPGMIELTNKLKSKGFDVNFYENSEGYEYV